MKEVAILLLLALMLNGCGSSASVQTASGSVWGAEMLGGEGTSSGFSFNTQFTVGSNGGALGVSNFQLLNQDTCFGSTPCGADRDIDQPELEFGRHNNQRHVFLQDYESGGRHDHPYQFGINGNGEP